MSEDFSNTFYYKKSRLQQLKGFYYTYQKGSVTKAAGAMGLSVSTITMQIKSLERDLNIILFNKKGNRLIPTTKAHSLYEMAIPVIHGADNLFKTFLKNSEEIDNNYIHLACHPNVAYEILPPNIKQFKYKNPKMVFEIDIIPIEEAINNVISEKLDFAIFPIDSNKRKNHEITYIDLLKDDVVLVMHKDHWLAEKKESEITKDDIAKSNFVCMDKSLVYTHKYLDFLLNNKNCTNDLLFNGANWEIVKSMVKQNLCTFGVTKNYINKEDEKILITKKINNIFPFFDYCIIIKKDILLKPNIKKFLKILNND